MGHPRRLTATAIPALAALIVLGACTASGSAGDSAGPSSSRQPTRTATGGTANPRSSETSEPGSAPPGESWVVVNVVDGDTIDVKPVGGTKSERIRLVGVDTPETKDPRKPVQCFGKEASEFTGRLRGRTVHLTYDVERRDRYGRTLAYVWLDDGSHFNLILAEEGYAQPLTIPPNVAHADEFVAAARRAREASKGLWSACQ